MFKVGQSFFRPYGAFLGGCLDEFLLRNRHSQEYRARMNFKNILSYVHWYQMLHIFLLASFCEINFWTIKFKCKERETGIFSMLERMFKFSVYPFRHFFHLSLSPSLPPSPLFLVFLTQILCFSMF